MKNIILIAAPSAGKGTQCALLVEEFGHKHISTGDLLRDAAKEDSDFGRDIARRMQAGELISDDIINVMLKNTLEKIGDQKFILDGYPRTINQAESLTEMFNELGIEDYVVIYLDIDRRMAMERALGRVTCDSCKSIYNIYAEGFKPKTEGICDNCSTPLMQRADDNEESFNNRFDTYVKNTEPILSFYENLGVLKRTQMQAEKEQSYNNVKKAIEEN